MQLPHPRISAVLLAVLAVVPFGVGLTQDNPATEPLVVEVQPTEPVTVFAVRHAEKAKDDPRDPGLTEAGEARAKELAELLGAAGITHIFTSPYKRTNLTVAPLAKATGLEVATYDPRDPSILMGQLRDLPPGSRAVVSGHSNTTPALVRSLGGDVEGLERMQGMAVIPDDQYDRLFVLTLGDAERLTSTVELRYGEASPR